MVLAIIPAFVIGASADNVTINNTTQSTTWGSGSSTMTWDANTKTLTLTNYTLDGALISSYVQTILLVGDNTINGGNICIEYMAGNSSTLTIRSADVTNPGSLTLICNTDGSSTNSFGIYAMYGSVSIEYATVNAIGGKSTGWSTGIFSGANTTITNSTVSVSGDVGGNINYGIYAENQISIDSSTVNAISAEGGTGISCDLLNIGNDSVVFAQGVVGIGVNNGDLTVGSNVKLTAIGNDTEGYNSCGIDVWQGKVDAAYTNSVITAIGGKATGQSVGIKVDKTSILSGTLTCIATAGASDVSQAYYCEEYKDYDAYKTLNFNARTDSGVGQSALSVTGLPSDVFLDDSFKLNVTGGSGEGVYYWETSNASVAIVDQSGNVIVNGLGEVTITAKRSADGNYREASKSVTFTVTCLHDNSNHTTGTDAGIGKHDFTCTVCGNTGSENHTGGNYSALGTFIIDTCTICSGSAGTATVRAQNAAYNGKPYNAAEVIASGTLEANAWTLIYADENTDNMSQVSYPGNYMVRITLDGFSVSAAFEIAKGSLKVEAAPETTYEFGDTYVGKEITGGKVVIVGNESAVIPGTWAWVGDTTTATFTPDAEYADLFETLTDAYDVTVKVTASVPSITLVSPSPSIMPEMNILMTVEAKNIYDESLTDLPTAFRIYYKIGEDGAPVGTDGLKFAIPTGVTIGEIVYVWVENVAVNGKYKATVSNTVELLVGQVDYTEAIENATAELKALIEEKADKATVNAAIEELENLIVVAEAAANQYADNKDAALKTELETAIEGAKTQLINGYTAAIDVAKTELETLIEEKADKATVNAAIEELENLIVVAEAAANEYADNKDAALKTELETAIAVAKTELINGYTAAIDAAKTELNAAIILKADTATLNEKVEALNKAIEAAEAAANEYADNKDAALKAELNTAIAGAKDEAVKYTDEVLNIAKDELNAAIENGDNALDEKILNLSTALDNAKKTLEAADLANKQALQQEIDSAEDALKISINKVAANLDQAKKDLTNAINTGDKDLDEKIAELDKALDDAKAALEAADKDNKAALEAVIAEGNSALDAAVKKVAKDLAALEKELEAKDAELTEKTEALTVALIVVGVFGCLGFAGSAGLITWTIVTRRNAMVDGKKKD